MDIAVDVARTVVGYSAKTVAAPINLAHRFVGEPLREFGDLQLEKRSSSCFSSPDDIPVDEGEDDIPADEGEDDIPADDEEYGVDDIGADM
jgi:hypothetical protein